MNIQILKHFIAIAKSDSISDASIKYQITQSNLSRSLKLLEDYVGEQLYNRYDNKSRLTPKGDLVLAEILEVVEYYETAISKLRSDFTNEKIHMGFAHGIGNILLPELLKSIEQDNKFIEIIPLQGTMHEVSEWLNLGKVTIAVNVQEAFNNDLYTNHMYDDEYNLVSHKDSNIPYGDTIHLSDITTLPLIAQNRKPPRTLQRICNEYGVNLRFVHQVESISLLWTLVNHNRGHTIQSEFLQIPEFINRDMLTIRKIVPTIKRPIAIGTNKYKSMSENSHYIYNKTQDIIAHIVEKKDTND